LYNKVYGNPIVKREINMEKYLTIGEFASLCGVKKDTIFYYDEIGLLKPDFTAENGYRYYSPKQVMVYEIISILKSVGMSLKEIIKYSARQNTKDYLDFLKEKREELIETQRRLEYTREFVDNTIGIIETSIEVDLDEIILEQCREEYLAIVSTPPVDDMNDRSYWVKIEELTDYCNRNKLGNVFPIGEVVLREKFLQNEFKSDYYCSKPVRKAKLGPNMIRKPAGKYAVLYHRGSYKSLPNAYRKLKDYLETNRFTIQGNVYEQDQLYLFSKSDSTSDYYMKISAAIE
jgi:DNA-binding transcriptional MerR regulator/effector-binding domain-containing protein